MTVIMKLEFWFTTNPVCVEINNCTNEEGKGNCVCTFSMEGRKFEKSLVSELGKNERENIFCYL